MYRGWAGCVKRHASWRRRAWQHSWRTSFRPSDPLVKYSWQSEMIAAVRKLNGCDADGTAWEKSGTLVGRKYASNGGTPVVTLIHPGGHVFPKEAPEMIVRFFKECEKK
jgi:polyhydroxybutyrate depolymerase